MPPGIGYSDPTTMQTGAGIGNDPIIQQLLAAQAAQASPAASTAPTVEALQQLLLSQGGGGGYPPSAGQSRFNAMVGSLAPLLAAAIQGGGADKLAAAGQAGSAIAKQEVDRAQKIADKRRELLQTLAMLGVKTQLAEGAAEKKAQRDLRYAGPMEAAKAGGKLEALPEELSVRNKYGLEKYASEQAIRDPYERGRTKYRSDTETAAIPAQEAAKTAAAIQRYMEMTPLEVEREKRLAKAQQEMLPGELAARRESAIRQAEDMLPIKRQEAEQGKEVDLKYQPELLEQRVSADIDKAERLLPAEEKRAQQAADINLAKELNSYFTKMPFERKKQQGKEEAALQRTMVSAQGRIDAAKANRGNILEEKQTEIRQALPQGLSAKPGYMLDEERVNVAVSKKPIIESALSKVRRLRELLGRPFQFSGENIGTFELFNQYRRDEAEAIRKSLALDVQGMTDGLTMRGKWAKELIDSITPKVGTDFWTTVWNQEAKLDALERNIRVGAKNVMDSANLTATGGFAEVLGIEQLPGQSAINKYLSAAESDLLQQLLTEQAERKAGAE